MEDSRNFQIPRLLDEPPKFLFWDFDVALLFIVGLGLGIVMGLVLLGIALGLACAYGWSKVKRGRHPGYGLHCVYWHTPVRFFRRTPPSARRHFVG